MAGKHIDKSLRTYIQGNQEAYKAFKMIEPLISLTESNGEGNPQLAKELEELRKERFKTLASWKLMEKITSKEQMEKAMVELAQEYGIKLQTEIKMPQGQNGANNFVMPRIGVKLPSIEAFATELAEAIEKKCLEERLLFFK
jgi:hypothetical protein